jgi:hypothetical protein
MRSLYVIIGLPVKEYPFSHIIRAITGQEWSKQRQELLGKIKIFLTYLHTADNP